ncbi:AraC family transcriptional regulator [Vibrio sinaloensis]|uniref:XRE family transcriptional regulator n=1 Tax=Photobacterium sp. (strain ATCC 43367) TaxID=379097 RepID=A0A0A5I458_PHOS4|nr:AraC family transcriptional regulator [Vibrio sinaloensis]KGY10509.1 XRE family transcriptional regulator [Vibrio sinaloensis]
MKLATLMQTYVDLNDLNNLEGIHHTDIEGVWFYRSSKGNARQPFVYQSGVIVLGQGHKNIYIGNQPVAYGPEDYLVVGVPMPLECEALAKDGEPLLGLSIDIDLQMLHRQVARLEKLGFRPSQAQQTDNLGLKSVSMDKGMLDTCIRVMSALCDPYESKILGDCLKEELVYRALQSAEGHVLFNLAGYDGHYARVARALEKVHEEYAENLTVQSLAEVANMSTSAFHHAFREVTLETPIQYIKKVRLNKAKELIQLEGKKVNDAARLVGYNSSSQFSREYKRHFNQTPKGLKLAS